MPVDDDRVSAHPGAGLVARVGTGQHGGHVDGTSAERDELDGVRVAYGWVHRFGRLDRAGWL